MATPIIMNKLSQYLYYITYVTVMQTMAYAKICTSFESFVLFVVCYIYLYMYMFDEITIIIRIGK